METKLKSALVGCPKALAHFSRPNSAGSAILRYFFEEVVMRVKKERDPWNKAIEFQPRPHSPLDILESISQRKGEFLNGGGSGFTYVITADGYRIVTRHMLSAKFKGIHFQLHGWPDGIDPFFLRYV